MDTGRTDPSLQTPEELAGPHYAEMMQSKDSATGFLSADDPRVCLAAILICETHWNFGADPGRIDACVRMAADSDIDDRLRSCAVGAIGRAASASLAPELSQFLADSALDCTNSMALRRDAYWALREVQFGLEDVDFDTFVQGVITTVKPIIAELPGISSEETTRRALTPQPGFPEDLWESADDIDWDFVRRFATPS